MRKRILLAVSVVVAIACALLIPHVNVNSDMTKYLPDDSGMSRGLAIINEEFGSSAQLTAADVRAMFHNLPASATDSVSHALASMEGVDGVTVSTSGDYTLFEMAVEKTVNQKRLAGGIRRISPPDTVVETSQDGNTPDPTALLLAVAALMVILFIMSGSWLEPILFLTSTGLAVAVNIGTNAFLESVSITTNSIVAVLQLALSMDYSIILMNRYRQERDKFADRDAAMGSAMKKAAPSILSSAFTTVVGLLMLLFMKLKIGADMGIVLAKGVICSLIFTYTALPGMILLSDKGIQASAKKVPTLPTDGLARFSTRFRIPLAIAFAAIFAGTFILHNKTGISFSTNFESGIDRIFPKKNTTVLLYSNEDEDAVAEMDDAISYPFLMLKERTPGEMCGLLSQLAPDRTGMLSEDILKLAYYAKFDGAEGLRVGFPELASFIGDELVQNPLAAGFIDDGMREKLNILKDFTGGNAITGAGWGEEIRDRVSGPAEDSPVPERMQIHEYMSALAKRYPSADTRMLAALTDTVRLRKRMGTGEMSAFIGSTASQTKMVYSLKGAGELTPLEFAHFLSDDLFNRKALASMVNREQKAGMRLRTRIMDYADRNSVLPLSTIESLVKDYGIRSLLTADDFGIPAAEPEKAAQKPSSPESAAVEGPGSIASEDNSGTPESTTEGDGVTDNGRMPDAAPEDPRLALITEMVCSGRKYTASQMARNFRVLGEKMDTGTVELMYMLYGCSRNYDDNWKMSLEELISFLSDNVMADPRFAPFISEDVRAQFSGVQEEMKAGLGQLKGKSHSLALFVNDLPDESSETESFLRKLKGNCERNLSGDHYLIGESVMFLEMKDGFSREMLIVTLLTILAIFTIVAITFKSPLIALILVMTVMSAVFVNVTVSGFGGRTMLYLAYLIVQSILMGATIDYGILFTNYFRETGSIAKAYRGSVHTILTSGLIMICVPGMMALLLDDAMIDPIVSSLSVGALSAVVMILTVMPGVLATFYKSIDSDLLTK